MSIQLQLDEKEISIGKYVSTRSAESMKNLYQSFFYADYLINKYSIKECSNCNILYDNIILILVLYFRFKKGEITRDTLILFDYMTSLYETYRDIGKKNDITSDRVRQIVKKEIIFIIKSVKYFFVCFEKVTNIHRLETFLCKILSRECLCNKKINKKILNMLKSFRLAENISNI